ncbi:aspartate kinase [Phaeosphaeriaceae sp. PMI808]|nr:aspartate kinase [Phaeosphaeriaceae sp. PMI808]
MPQIYSKSWLVQKYGGTSIGKILPEITSSIIPSYLEIYNVAVVCSARSGTTKSKGTTSLLLDAIQAATAIDPQVAELNAIINIIKEENSIAAQVAVGDGSAKILETVQFQIKKDCERLRSLLKATMMLGEISDRTTDRVLAIGETLSCRVVAASLESKGIPSMVVLLENIVEETYGDDHRQLTAMFKKHPGTFLRGLTDAIRRRIELSEGAVPVITGFFGAIPGSLIKNISRGYSDLCAALCAIGLNADELQIWKEVDGIFTADPRKIKAARLLATVTSEEAAELTYYGSEVIHPLTIEQIDGAGIFLRLKNVKNPHGEGTIIHPSEKISPSPSLMDMQAHIQYRRKPTAVTTKENIIVLNIRSHSTTSPTTFLNHVSNCLSTHNIKIDLISSSQQMLSLAICAPEPHAFRQAKLDLEEMGQVSLLDSMSIVSVIGHRMRNVVGIGAEIFSSLASARVNIYLISQGASEINISFVIKGKDAQLAMEAVHENVVGIPRHEERENAFVKGPGYISLLGRVIPTRNISK